MMNIFKKDLKTKFLFHPSRNKWLRSLNVWKYFADYFPMKIIKTVDLPPNKNYLFAYHPHGIICFTFFIHFGTNGTNFHDIFPGIKCNLCTIRINHLVAFYRHLVLAWGVISIKYKTIKYMLSQTPDQIINHEEENFTSNAVAIAVGGAQECIYTKKGQYMLHLRNRKGFIRAAIETGASIVPVFTFGENDVYDVLSNEPGSLWRRFQEFHKKYFVLTPVIFWGRGMFQHNFGLLPRRVPINTVFGGPMDVEKKENPTQEEIDKVHERYLEVLEALFEEHKWKYVKNAGDLKLIMV